MAAPTDVRVESNSTTSATLRWADNGTIFLRVYRAPNGGAFAEIGQVNIGVQEFVDLTVDAGAFYDYKLSDNNGSTFSAVVSVVILKCEPAWGANQFTQTIALPRPHSDEDITAHYLQNILAQIEAQTNVQVKQDPCDICSEEGAILFDCTNGCFNFRVIIDEEINSITVVGCEDGIIEWICPPNQECKVCGWPSGFGFGGDECKYNPIFGGPAGRTVSTTLRGRRSGTSPSRKGYNPRGGGGAGGLDCPCTPDPENQLRIVCCTVATDEDVSKPCSLNCAVDAALDGKRAKLKICGGQGPYLINKTGGIKLTADPDAPEPVLLDSAIAQSDGAVFYAVAPPNPGSAVGGVAYQVCYYIQQRVPTCDATPTAQIAGATLFGCGDVLGGCTTTPFGCEPGTTYGPGAMSCVSGLGTCNIPQCVSSLGGMPGCNPGNLFQGQTHDRRTAPMIAAGCEPCGLQAGSTVSITDMTGVTVTRILSP